MELGGDAINRPKVPTQYGKSQTNGSKAASHLLSTLARRQVASSRSRSCLIAVDGFLGRVWDNIIFDAEESLENASVKCVTVDIGSYYKPNEKLERMLNSVLASDKFFGRIFDGDLEDLLDLGRIRSLRRQLDEYRKKKTASDSSSGVVVFCHGFGAANRLLHDLFDYVFFVDITREELPKRIEKKEFRFLTSLQTQRGESQVADIGVPVHLFKLLTYVFYPILEKYKKRLLRYIDYYVDGNVISTPKIVPREVLDEVLSLLVQSPFRLKPLYVPGPWGGQWIKKLRKLPSPVVNCAWGFEAIAPEMSVKISLGSTCLEIPFNTLLVQQSQKIMGSAAAKRFGSFFPIRVHYDDSMDGGNMAIQVHPPAFYVKNHFNERVGQDESYYIAVVGPGSKVFLGVKNNVDCQEFSEAVRKSEIEGTPMDYQRYVNSIPSRVGDLFLIPAGTVHASGRNEIVLEIGNSYGYTFHIYDYVRPDLNGNLRPIHADHAFQVLKFHRNASWTRKHLKQKPKLKRSGRDWAEYSLGELREIFYKIHRLEFLRRIDDTADGRFHILTLIEGQRIAVQSKEDPSRRYTLNFSETVIVPACLGEYSITNLGTDPCKVIKVFLK